MRPSVQSDCFQPTPSEDAGFESGLSLRCHNTVDNIHDSETAIWKVAFKPSSHVNKTASDKPDPQLVASCGGNVLNVIDCEKETVLVSFRDPSMKEILCFAWGVLGCCSKCDPDSHRYDALAFAGKANHITIIVISKDGKHVSKNGQHLVRFRAHTPPVVALTFHPDQEMLLFSGGGDKHVKLWDLANVFYGDDSTSKDPELLQEVSVGSMVRSMDFSPKYDALLIGADEGLYVWQPFQGPGKYLKNLHRIDLSRCCAVTCVKMIPDSNHAVFLVRNEWRLIIIDLEKTLDKSESKTKLPLIVFGESTVIPCTLFSPLSDIVGGLIACGDGFGRIWIFDLKNLDFSASALDGCFKQKGVLEVPKLGESIKAQATIEGKPVIGCVAISPDLRHIVAGTNMNLITLWHKKEENQIGDASS